MTEDPYTWLEAIDDPRVVRWAIERDRRARGKLSRLSRLLADRIRRYYSIPTLISVKIGRDGYFLFRRVGPSYRIDFMSRGGEISKVVDSNELGDNVVITSYYASRVEPLLAYTFSQGSDEGIARVIDVRTGEVLDELRGVIRSIVLFAPDKYYYVRQYRREKTPDGVSPPAARVFLRENGRDEMVFGEGLPSSILLSIRSSTDYSKALLSLYYGWVGVKAYGGKINDPDDWSFLYGSEDYPAYPVDYVGGRYLVLSYEGEGRGMVIALRRDGDRRVLVREKEYLIEGVTAAREYMVVHRLVDGHSELYLHDLDGRKLGSIPLKGLGTVSSMSTDGVEVLFKYTSYSIPYRLYRLRDGRLELVLSEGIEGDFEIQEAWTTSKDGTRIHMFIFKRKGAPEDKVLLYGYGGFGLSITPKFYPFIIPLTEDGGVFVATNLRGGGEYGEQWHRAGMRDKKQNVFDDFIACAEYFKEKGAKVVAYGVSNGGLLVAAVLTQRPELFDGVVIGYPVLDMLRFHKLHVGKLWISEYGDPESPEDAEYLARYSPYHNVKKVKYPPVLIHTGLKDDRVHPAHAFKFTAKLEEVGAPVLLRVETVSGHSGASPEIKVKEYADILAFIYEVLGIKPRET